jgi:hypothetical protein
MNDTGTQAQIPPGSARSFGLSCAMARARPNGRANRCPVGTSAGAAHDRCRRSRMVATWRTFAQMTPTIYRRAGCHTQAGVTVLGAPRNRSPEAWLQIKEQWRTQVWTCRTRN